MEVTAICDINEEKLAKAKEIIGNNIKTYIDYKVLLAEKACDAIIIATAHYQHTVIAIDAFNADFHVTYENLSLFMQTRFMNFMKLQRSRTSYSV